MVRTLESCCKRAIQDCVLCGEVRWLYHSISLHIRHVSKCTGRILGAKHSWRSRHSGRAGGDNRRVGTWAPMMRVRESRGLGKIAPGPRAVGVGAPRAPVPGRRVAAGFAESRAHHGSLLAVRYRAAARLVGPPPS